MAEKKLVISPVDLLTGLLSYEAYDEGGRCYAKGKLNYNINEYLTLNSQKLLASFIRKGYSLSLNEETSKIPAGVKESIFNISELEKKVREEKPKKKSRR